jgi:hypothetical protein
LTQIPGSRETTSTKTLVAITAAIVGALLFIISIASIAAMLSMGSVAEDRAQIQSQSVGAPSENDAGVNREPIPELNPIEGVENEPIDDDVKQFFDALYGEEFMSGSPERS